jgi:hypothetical protein
MRSYASLLVTVLLVTPAASAQQPTKLEVGTHFGGTVAFGGGSTEVLVAAPNSGSFFAWPSLYLSLFPTPGLMVEPQLGVAYSSGDDEVLFIGALQLGYLLAPRSAGSPYFGVQGGFSHFGSLVDSGIAGAAFGYRFLIQQRLAIRAEAGYRRWLCSGCDLNEATVQIGLGAALP